MILRRATAAKLTTAHEDLTATEAAISDLQRERDGKLLDASADEIDALDRKINDRRRVAAVYGERISVLEARLVTEQAEQQQRRRKAAVAKAEALLPKRIEAARGFEDAVRGVSLALERLDQARSKIVAEWPDGVELPYAFFLDTSRSTRVLFEAIAAFAPDWKLGGELADKLLRMREAVAGFADVEAQHHAELVEQLRQPAPKPEVESQEDAA
jgi:hypothetical protein